MSDDETRREDARIEEAICGTTIILLLPSKTGTWGMCSICGDPTPEQEPEEVAQFYSPRWICKYCQRMMDAPGD